MLTKVLHRGSVITSFVRYCKNCGYDNKLLELEYTRHRKKPAGGGRYLTDSEYIYLFNAWDNVDWDEGQESIAKQKVKQSSEITFSEDQLKSLEVNADKHWNSFYDIHQNRFFKDRHWLFTEFPELAPNTTLAPEEKIQKSENNDVAKLNTRPKHCIFEIGCGVGNTIFPILKYSQDPNLFVYGCDFSTKAIDIMKQSELYDTKRCNVFVLDVTHKEWDVPFKRNSIDIIVLIFVLNAIHPEKMSMVINNIYKYLKPGGLVLFRDHGLYDLIQLRFKKGRCISKNFYARADNTKVYFFTQEEITNLFQNAGFKEEQNLIDRRLTVNRAKMLKMYRIWIQGKYRKPL